MASGTLSLLGADTTISWLTVAPGKADAAAPVLTFDAIDAATAPPSTPVPLILIVSLMRYEELRRLFLSTFSTMMV